MPTIYVQEVTHRTYTNLSNINPDYTPKHPDTEVVTSTLKISSLRGFPKDNTCAYDSSAPRSSDLKATGY